MIGTLYFIQAGSAGPIKIGFTTGDYAKRLATLQVGNAEELVSLAALENYPDTEKDWHIRFADLRIRGEWFLPARKLTTAVSEAVATHRPPADRLANASEVTPLTPKDLKHWAIARYGTIKAFAAALGYSPSVVGEHLKGRGFGIGVRMANRMETVSNGELSAVAIMLGSGSRSNLSQKWLPDTRQEVA